MRVEIVCPLFYFLFVVETWNIESVPMIGDIVVAHQVIHIFLILKELFILKVLFSDNFVFYF